MSGQSDQGVPLGFDELIKAILERKWFVVAATLLAATLSAAIVLSLPSVYRASVVLIPASQRADLGASLGSALGSLGGLAALAGVNLESSRQETDEAIAVLKSREFSYKFIADLGLAGKFFPKQWDERVGDWRADLSKKPTEAKAYKYFDRRVRTVEQDRRTGLITLNVFWRDPEAAAVWANQLVARLNVEMQRRAIDVAQRSIEFLEAELAKTNVVETRNAINRIIETQINKRMLASVSDQFAFRVIDKAVAPDLDDRARPKRLLAVLVAAIFGFLASITWVLLASSRRLGA